MLSLITLLVVQDNPNARNPVRNLTAVPFERLLSLDDWLPQHQLIPGMPLVWEAQAAILHIGHYTTSGEALNCQICAAIDCVSCHHQPWEAFSIGRHVPEWCTHSLSNSVAISNCIPCSE